MMLVEWQWCGETKVPWRKHGPVLFRTPQIPCELPWFRTRTCASWGRRLKHGMDRTCWMFKCVATKVRYISGCTSMWCQRRSFVVFSCSKATGCLWSTKKGNVSVSCASVVCVCRGTDFCVVTILIWSSLSCNAGNVCRFTVCLFVASQKLSQRLDRCTVAYRTVLHSLDECE